MMSSGDMKEGLQCSFARSRRIDCSNHALRTVITLSTEIPNGSFGSNLDSPGWKLGSIGSDGDETRIETDSTDCRVLEQSAGRGKCRLSNY